MALQIKTQGQLFKAYIVAFIIGSLIDLLVLYIDNKGITFQDYVESAHVVLFVIILQIYSNYIRNIQSTLSEEVFTIKRKSAVILTWIVVYLIAFSFQIAQSIIDKMTINWHKSLGILVVWTIMFGLYLLIFSDFSFRKKQLDK